MDTSGQNKIKSDTKSGWSAEYWLKASATPDMTPAVALVGARAAQALGQRTGHLPMIVPLTMLALLAASPQIFVHLTTVIILFAVMTIAATARVGLGKELTLANARNVLPLAQRYRLAVDVAGFAWGCLVGLMIMVRGIDQVTELALVATVAINASALTSLTLELSLWRRFLLASWIPLMALTALAAFHGTEYGWLLLLLEVLFAAFAAIQGQYVVRDYIGGLLSRIELESAASTIANQRDELRVHQSRLDELLTRTHNLSYYDQLTGIGSRTHFCERMDANIAASRISGNRFAVLYLDINGFRDINDTLGHAAGDELLKTIALRVRSLLRASDFAARLGSDELALFINNISHGRDAITTVQRCLKEIQLPVNLAGRLISPRVSIGVALFPADGEETLTLVKAAESAMNAAKSNTKLHYARYSPEMTLAAKQRLTIEQELSLALANDQFLLHYQPQIDTYTGMVSGVEALVRWHHPERGLIPPNDFITVAENTGLIDELGQWVIMTACRQAAEWLKDGVPPLSVAVNISPLQLMDSNLVDGVREALESSGLSPKLLELEITESAVQTHAEARENLQALSALGIRIAIDDFGTGYSSLGSLKELPINRVKIDRVFVVDMLASERDTALLGNIVDMAHVLGCDVVAEGVEEQAHVDKLRSLNCDCLQGYFFSRPVPADAIPAVALEARSEKRDPQTKIAF